MELFRQALATIKKHLGQLRPTDKLLIGSLMVIITMALVLVAMFSANRRMVELLPGMAAADQRRAATFLTAASVPNQVGSDGKLMVPSEREGQARALLAENGQLSGDKATMFDNLLEKQSWMLSNQQNAQIFMVALQNQLASDIAKFKGVRSATVILDIPEATGIGRAVRKPTASATVTTRDGSPLAQSTVDAIAGYIAGSRAGLGVEQVRVIDASTGKQRRPTTESDMIPTTYLEHAARVEGTVRDRLSELLGYIPGVIVAVTAQVDVTRVESTTTSHLPTGQGTLSEIRKTTEDTTNSAQSTPGAEPGLQSNVAADVSRGKGGAGNTSSTTKTENEFEILPGTKSEKVADPRGMPTMVAVSVSVPYGFVEALVKKQSGSAGAAAAPAGGAGSAGVDEKSVNDLFDKQVRPKIEALIRPQVRALSASKGLSDQDLDKLMQQSVSVAMVPMDVPVSVGVSQQAGFMGGAINLALGGGLVEKAVLGVLSLLAVGMMFMLVRRAGKKADIPTAEELVGLPPQLASNSDVIGEAVEGDAPLAGIEVGEEQVQAQKMLEQVGDLVKQNPQAAAKLVSRWITSHE